MCPNIQLNNDSKIQTLIQRWKHTNLQTNIQSYKQAYKLTSEHTVLQNLQANIQYYKQTCKHTNKLTSNQLVFIS